MTRLHSHVHALARTIGVLVALAVGGAASARADICAAPNDGVTPAEAAINACIAQAKASPTHPPVVLAAGTYLIAYDSVRFEGTDHLELTSESPNDPALLRASPYLGKVNVINASGSWYVIHDIHIDGGLGEGRNAASGCTGPNDPQGPALGANLGATGDHYTLYDIDSRFTPCGNWQIAGNYFTIHHNFLFHNGVEIQSGGPVGDGMTVYSGQGGDIFDNTIQDFTDIGMPIAGGSRHVHNNHFLSQDLMGIAALNMGHFGDGNHSGAIYEGNVIEAAVGSTGPGKLAIGLLLGSHPWDSNVTVSNAGTVKNNTVSGATIGIVVDGISSVDLMENNTVSGPLGFPIMPGNSGLGGPSCSGHPYTAWHTESFGDTGLPASQRLAGLIQQIQPGWYAMEYDSGRDCPPMGIDSPTVSLSVPTSGSSVSFQTSAAPVGNQAIVSIQYVKCANNVGTQPPILTCAAEDALSSELTVPPYNFTWTGAAPGQYWIVARAMVRNDNDSARTAAYAPAVLVTVSAVGGASAGALVNLQAPNGQYFCAEWNGGMVVNANRDVASTWETFTLLDLNANGLRDGDPVAFQTSAGYYFQARWGGNDALGAYGIYTIGTWETFTLIDLDHPGGFVTAGDRIALRSYLPYYVTAVGGGGGSTNVTGTTIGGFQTLRLIIH